MDWHESAKQEHFSKPARWPWVAAFVAVTAGGIYAVTRGGPEEPEPAPESLELVAPQPEPEAAEAASSPMPSKRQTDALIHDLIGDFAALAGVRDLVARFVSAVNQIADGEIPKEQLGFLAPKGRFRASDSGGDLVIDERSYRRFDALAGLLGSIDVARAAEAFRELEPVLDRSHEELGAPDRSFRETLALAIDHLCRTPIPDGPIQLRRKRKSYGYADPTLDALSDAQKQLLRMGPRNAGIVQRRLRELGVALDLPPVRQHAAR